MPRVSSHFDLQDPRNSTVVMETFNPPTITTAGTTGVTYTPAQLLSGMVIRGAGPTGAISDNLPTAAALCEAIQGCFVNLSFVFRVRNASSQTLTLVAGPNSQFLPGSLSPMTVLTTAERAFRLQFTNVSIGQEAYTVWPMGGPGTYNT